MIFSRKFLALTAAAALSFAFTACDDDSGNTNPEEENKCTAAQNTCKSDAIASQCIDGAMKDVACEANQKCVSGACVANGGGEQTKKCTAGEYTCDGQLLKKCKDDGSDYEEVDACEAPNPICDADAKKCTNECTETDPNTCDSEKVQIVCKGGKKEKVDCAAGTKCVDGECKAECDPEKDVPACDGDRVKRCDNGKFVYDNCNNDQKCDVEKAECVSKQEEVKKDSVIGTPCKCEGDDCTFKITGAEIKAALNTSNIKMENIAPDMCAGIDGKLKCAGINLAIGAMLPGYLKKIPDDGYVEAPNFFSAASQKACGNVKAPEGMVVGCLRDSKIDLSTLKLGDLLGEVNTIIDTLTKASPDLEQQITEALAAIGGMDGLNTILGEVKTIVNAGVQFSSANGYCLAADIDIKLNVTDEAINSIIDMKKVDPMLAKINTTGTDHSKAKNATCPEGSSLLWYDVESGGGAEDKGEAKVGFDMCLKTCKTDDDCKRDGVDDKGAYKCIEIPYGTAEDVAAKTKTANVCFDETNMTYFEEITKKFEGLIPSEDEAAKN